SSVAVTTLDREYVAKRAPRSTADLFKAIPGLWVESSVGSALNDVFVRGIPVGGQTRFLSIMEDGMPLFPGGDIAFLESDQFLRLDETLERVESIRGGTAAVLASNAPGGIINVVSRTGSPTLSGAAGARTSTHGLTRFDLGVGGSLASDWRFNVGGFARRDPGVVDPGFTSDRGWQIKANATRLFRGGLARAYVKVLDDTNYIDVGGPYRYDNGLLRSIPGFELGKDSYASRDLRSYRFPLPGGSATTRRISDGSRVQQFVIGADVIFDLSGDWLLVNKLRYVDSDANVDLDLDFEPPMPLTDFGQGILGALGPVFGASGIAYSYASDGATISDPAGLNGNGLVANGLPVFSVGSIDSLSNHLELRKSFARHHLTAGLQISHLDMQRTIRSSFVNKETANHPGLIDLTLTGSPLGPIPVTSEGFLSFGTSYENDLAAGELYGLFVNDTVSVTERLRLDVGARYEWHDLNNTVEDTRVIDLDGNPLTIFDAGYVTGSGTFTDV
ncbi:MAG: TonB-dependent receptor plug domain-containing protein, partial [Planctomycetota bacterium]